MAKKKKSINQTREELRNLEEAKRHLQAMMNYWRLRADKAHCDKEILAQEEVIRKAQAKIAKIKAEHERAPKQIKAIRESTARLEGRKSNINNRHLIARMKRIAAQIAELEDCDD